MKAVCAYAFYKLVILRKSPMSEFFLSKVSDSRFTTLLKEGKAVLGLYDEVFLRKLLSVKKIPLANFVASEAAFQSCSQEKVF